MSWGMADRCSGAWLTTMGLAAVVVWIGYNVLDSPMGDE